LDLPFYIGKNRTELLGVVTSIVDNSSYLRVSEFIVECDHQALRSHFENKFKCAIYERWLAVLQQYNFEIIYTRCTNAGRRSNDGKVEFENASVEINNVELFGDIDVADEDNDPLEISKEISESSLPKNVQGRVYSEEPVQVVSECRSPQDGQICSEINEVNAILPITFVLIPDMTNIQLVILIH